MKPAIILLHGALGTQHSLSPIAELLLSGFEVHSFDFIGHGKEQESKEFNSSMLVEQLHSNLSKLNGKKPYVFGYSMGGYIALQYAIQYPNSFKSIFTLGTKLEWSPSIAEREISQLNPDKIESKVPKFAQHLSNQHQNWKQVVRNTAKMMQNLGSGGGFSFQELTQISIPVFMSLGELDNMVSAVETKEAVKFLPNGQYLKIPNTLHPIERVNPDVIANYILSLMLQHE